MKQRTAEMQHYQYTRMVVCTLRSGTHILTLVIRKLDMGSLTLLKLPGIDSCWHVLLTTKWRSVRMELAQHPSHKFHFPSYPSKGFNVCHVGKGNTRWCYLFHPLFD